jgi:hypothetical protein
MLEAFERSDYDEMVAGLETDSLQKLMESACTPSAPPQPGHRCRGDDYRHPARTAECRAMASHSTGAISDQSWRDRIRLEPPSLFQKDHP